MTSILDKHPAPWRYDSPKFAQMSILDANGKPVAAPTTQIKDETNEIDFASPEAERLILAAPELLAHQLRCPVWIGDGQVCSRVHPTKSREDMLMEWLQEGAALIARIEGGK